jgi:hypothetical protein
MFSRNCLPVATLLPLALVWTAKAGDDPLTGAAGELARKIVFLFWQLCHTKYSRECGLSKTI